MSELTPLNHFQYPSEREKPYYATAKGNYLAVDASIWALAEDQNLVWNGGGLISWSATASTLTWVQPIYVTPFTSAEQARAVIAGPPNPGGTLKLADGQVAFFTMPRLMTQDTAVQLTVGTRIYQPNGTRQNDLIMFVARSGNTVLFANGKSLTDGESATLFGGGIGTSIFPHQHQPALIIEPPAIGVGDSLTPLDIQITALGDETLILFNLNGIFAAGDNIVGAVSGTTATVASVTPTFITLSGVAGPGFIVGELISAPAVNEVQIVINAIVGIFSVGDLLSAPGATGVLRQTLGSPTITSVYAAVTTGFFPVIGTLTDITSSATAHISNTILLGNPSATVASIIPPSNLLQAEVYRNGVLQAEGLTRDYTLDYSTGKLTLTRPTVSTSERFVILRITIPSGSASIYHQHLKLPIPISVTPTPTLDMQLTNVNPSPTKLIDIDLFRNGALQAEPADYALDAITGIVTLVNPAIAGEYFIAERQVE